MVNNQYFGYPQWHPLTQHSIREYHRRSIQMKKKHNTGKTTRKRKSSCLSTESSISRKLCYVLVALSLFVIILVVVAIAILAIYIGMEIILDGSIRITHGDHYSSELSNRSSQIFVNKAHLYKSMIEKLFNRSTLNAALKQCVIMGFKNGSLVVFYRLVLDRRKIPGRILANLEEAVKRIIFEESTTLKPTTFTNIRVDPKQIIVRRNSGNVNNGEQTSNANENKTNNALQIMQLPRMPSREATGDSGPQIVKSTDMLRKSSSSSSGIVSSFSRKKASTAAPSEQRSKPMKKLSKPATAPVVEKFDRIRLELEPEALNNKPIAVGKEPTSSFSGIGTRRKFPGSSRTKQTMVKDVANGRHHSERISFISLDDESGNNDVTDETAASRKRNLTNQQHTGIGEVEVILDPTSSSNVDKRNSFVRRKTENAEKAELAANNSDKESKLGKNSRTKNNDNNRFGNYRGNDTNEVNEKPVNDGKKTPVPENENTKTKTNASITDIVVADDSSDKTVSKDRETYLNNWRNTRPTTRSTDGTVGRITKSTTRSEHQISSEVTRPAMRFTDETSSETNVPKSSSSSYDPLLYDVDDKTETNNLVVLNTEVVTSTSMQISYGNKVIFNGDTQSILGNLADRIFAKRNRSQNAALVPNDNNADGRLLLPVTHYNAPETPFSEKKSNISLKYRYKSMSPRSLFNVASTEHRIRKRLSSPEDERTLSLNSAIEKYKKNPSNETLQIIINHLATLYAKSSTASPTNTIAFQSTDDHSGASSTPSSVRGFIDNNNLEYKMNDHHPIADSVSLTVECPTNATYQCANGDCISQHSWCNQLIDCIDGSDEKNCTCADYLRAQFATKKICDGIVDCWDFSDENSCEWCSPDKYVCSNAKLCISQSQICDGSRDCPHGDDERNCISIAPSISKQADVTYYTSGFVMVRRAGKWGKLCFDSGKENDSASDTLTKMSELGRAVCRTMTFRNFVRISKVPDEKSTNNGMPQMYYRLTHIGKNGTNYFKRKNFRFVRTNCENKEVIQVKCSNLECGIQTEIGKIRPQGRYRGERHSRIVGGGSAALGAWPWQAALYKEGEFQCGATLISDKWLLSAGHCFYNALDEYWVARLGILRRGSTLPSPYEQIYPIHRIILHPAYMDAGFINDISLLEMKHEVQFTNFVRPICLPHATSALTDGAMCTVIGWGQLLEIGRVFPDTLQEVQLPVISTSECRKRTMFLPLYKVTDNMLCAGFERGGRDACLGDSGGPLMCQDSNNGAWYLHGVTSNGYGCARANRPGVYTKVVNYINWISETMLNSEMARNSTKTLQDTCTGHRCPLGECLSRIRVCNGYMECSDGSDENKC